MLMLQERSSPWTGSRVAWVKERGRVVGLLEDLRELKNDLCLELGVMNVYVTVPSVSQTRRQFTVELKLREGGA